MPRRSPSLLALPLALGMLGWTVPLAAQEPAPTEKVRTPRSSTPRGPRTYMGRPIADVMSYHGAEWLVRPEREEEERPEEMLDALKIAPGSTVADIGSGVGYTSLRLAKRGRVEARPRRGRSRSPAGSAPAPPD